MAFGELTLHGMIFNKNLHTPFLPWKESVAFMCPGEVAKCPQHRSKYPLIFYPGAGFLRSEVHFSYCSLNYNFKITEKGDLH